jgi:cell division protein FtsI/penicillin-binding protein 2
MVQSSLRAKMMEAFRMRMFVYGAIVGIAFFIVILQLVNLQLIHGADYKAKSRMNMENNIPIPASRGEIYDRNFRKDSSNVTIVSNRPSFNLSTIPSKFASKEQMARVFRNISLLVKIPENELMEEMAGKIPGSALSLWRIFPLRWWSPSPQTRINFPTSTGRTLRPACTITAQCFHIWWDTSAASAAMNTPI